MADFIIHQKNKKKRCFYVLCGTLITGCMNFSLTAPQMIFNIILDRLILYYYKRLKMANNAVLCVG